MAMGPEHADRPPVEPDVDLEQGEGIDLLGLNHDLNVQILQLEAAIHSHRRIGIATGLVMAQHHIGGDDAFAVLRRASQDSNRKLRDLAEDVISMGRLSLVPVPGRRAAAEPPHIT